MVKSSFQIQMDYNNAIRQASSLEQVARELKSTADKDFQNCMSEISRSWTGSNASAYISKCRRLQEKIAATAGRLNRTADTIRKMAKNTYDAEMKALALAKLRKY